MINFSITGVLSGETISITRPQGQFASRNVGTGLTVTTELGNSDFAPVSGTSLANYSLPTSASGTIGTLLTHRLLAAGYRVRACGRDGERLRARLPAGAELRAAEADEA